MCRFYVSLLPNSPLLIILIPCTHTLIHHPSIHSSLSTPLHLYRYAASILTHIAYGHTLTSLTDPLLLLADKATTETVRAGSPGSNPLGALVEFYPVCECSILSDFESLAPHAFSLVFVYVCIRDPSHLASRIRQTSFPSRFIPYTYTC